VRADTSERRAIDAADRDPPTCQPDDFPGEVAGGTSGGGVVVTNEHRVVLGRVTPRTSAVNSATRVDEAMEPGPTTVRGHEPLVPVLERMARPTCRQVLVTTPEGQLLGVVRRVEEAP